MIARMWVSAVDRYAHRWRVETPRRSPASETASRVMTDSCAVAKRSVQSMTSTVQRRRGASLVGTRCNRPESVEVRSVAPSRPVRWVVHRTRRVAGSPACAADDEACRWAPRTHTGSGTSKGPAIALDRPVRDDLQLDVSSPIRRAGSQDRSPRVAASAADLSTADQSPARMCALVASHDPPTQGTLSSAR
jgi:hypothetical protein